MLLQLSKSPRALVTIVLLMGAPALLAQTPETREQRIRAVENGLITYVPVKGLAAWNLQERMRYYEVPGLTIGVIHN